MAGLETPQVREEMSNSIHNQMWNIPGPKHIDRTLTPHDKYFAMIFGSFTEITKSFRCLCDIEVYIQRFPYGRTTVSKSRHLEYHIANYFQEVYILNNRLDNYLKRIKRANRKSPEANAIDGTCGSLESLVQKGFESITLVRGVHVHEQRYCDDNFDRLQLWELLASHPKTEEEVKMLGYVYNSTYKEIRKEWKNRLINNNTGRR